MADWGHGYTTSGSYTFGFYREMAPIYLSLICLLQGIAPPQGKLTCLELGCGQGLGPNLLAASNPDHDFIGVDFLPEHIARARNEATTFGLNNVTFLETDFQSLASDPSPLPPCDFITLHGIYSWVSEDSRRAIRAIIRERLKPGGLVYVSYNCAAGWGPSALLQKLIYELSTARGGTPRQTRAAVERLNGFREHAFFEKMPGVKARLESLTVKDPNYVHHEYLNSTWVALHSVDVARDMAASKLSFVGSGYAVDNLNELSLPPEIMGTLAEEADLGLLEMLKDTFAAKMFRVDVFIRGAVRLTARDSMERLSRQPFALLKPRASIALKVPVPRGTIELGKSFYPRALELLESGITDFSSITSRLKDMRDLVSFLLGLKAIHPARHNPVASPTALALNRFYTRSAEGLMPHRVYAAPLLGSAMDVEGSLSPAFAAVLRGEVIDDAKLEALWSDPQYAPFYKKGDGGEVTLETVREQVPAYLKIWEHIGLTH